MDFFLEILFLRRYLVYPLLNQKLPKHLCLLNSRGQGLVYEVSCLGSMVFLIHEPRLPTKLSPFFAFKNVLRLPWNQTYSRYLLHNFC